MKKIYIGGCEHLQNCCITDDECLKRYIHINNPRNNDSECLVFCNDYLKLKAQEKNQYKEVCKNGVFDIVEKEVLKYLKIEKQYSFANSVNSLSNHIFYHTVCERPHIHIQLKFNDLIGFYYQNPTRETMEFIRVELISFLNSIQYKKYKNKYKSLLVLSNKLSCRDFRTNEEKEIILLELINETFKLTIKNQ